MTVILVALGAFLLGAGAVGWSAHHFLAIGFQLGRDDAALDPGPTIGALPLPDRPVGEASGRHHKPQASDGPPPDEDVWLAAPVWPGEEDTQQIAADVLHDRTEDARDRYQEEVTT